MQNYPRGHCQTVQEENKRDQFLMKLRPEFETCIGWILNQNPIPSMDICVDMLQ